MPHQTEILGDFERSERFLRGEGREDSAKRGVCVKRRNLPLVRPQVGEEEVEAIRGVIESGILAEGHQTSELEREFANYVGVKEAIAVANGTAALQIAVQAAGIQPGDEVVTTAFTFIASSNSICFAGGIPIFADIDRQTYCLDPDEVRKAVTPRTRAILPVHIFGLPCDMPALMDIAEDHDLLVLEDCAQAHGASIGGGNVGTYGQGGCFSFYATKNMISAEGGIITTNDVDFAERCRSLKNHGRPPSGGYRHTLVGYNLRISDVHSAIARVQLKKLPGMLMKRAENARILREGIESSKILSPQFVSEGYTHANYIFSPTVIADHMGASDIIKKLQENNISARTIYSIPTYEQPAYTWLREKGLFSRWIEYPDYARMHLENTEYVAKRHFEVPVHPGILPEEAQFIADTLRTC